MLPYPTGPQKDDYMHSAIRELIKSGFSMTGSGEGVKERRVSFYQDNVKYEFRRVDCLTLECTLGGAVVVTYRDSKTATGDMVQTASSVEVKGFNLKVDKIEGDKHAIMQLGKSDIKHYNLDRIMFELKGLIEAGTALLEEMRVNFHLLSHPKKFSGKGSHFTGYLNGVLGSYECLLTTGEITLIKNDIKARLSQLLNKEKSSRVVSHINSLLMIVEGLDRHMNQLPLSQSHDAAAMILSSQLHYKKCY